MIPTATRHALGAAILIALNPFLSVQAATPAAHELLPEDSLVVLTFPDWKAFTEARSIQQGMQLWNDPAMRPFREHFMKGFRKDVLNEFQSKLGMNLEDLVAIPQGQWTVALTEMDLAGETEEPGAVTLLDGGDNTEGMDQLMKRVREEWKSRKVETRPERIRGVEFERILFDADAEESSVFKRFFLGRVGNVMVAGDDRTGIEKIVSRLQGDRPRTLGETPHFRNDFQSQLKDSLMYGWVHLERFISLGTAKLTEREAQPGQPNPAQVMNLLGIGGVKSASFFFKDHEQGSMAEFFLNFPEGQRKSIFTQLPAVRKDSSPPPFVGKEAVRFMRWRLDLGGIWKAVEQTLASINPMMAGMFKGMINQMGREKDPSFDIQSSVFANLGDDIIMWENPPKDNNIDALASPPSVVLIGSPNAKALLEVARTAVSSFLGGESLKEREFLSRKILELEVPSMSLEEQELTTSTLSLAEADGYLAISDDQAMLENYLRGNTGSSSDMLRNLPDLNRAAEKVGGLGTGFLSYEDQRAAGRAFFSMIRKNPDLLKDLLGDDEEDFPVNLDAAVAAEEEKENGPDFNPADWFDFRLLPEFTKVAKYFYFNITTAEAGPRGYHIKVFNPVPPELR